MVEKPWIYLLANCNDNLVEKMSVVPERREDILQMAEPLVVDGATLRDKMRFFQGEILNTNVSFFTKFTERILIQHKAFKE